MPLIVVAAVVAAVLLAAAVMDMTARRRGHRLRGSAGWMGVRESRRDQRAGQVTGFLGSNDTTWTATNRRNIDARAQQRREDQP